MSITVLLDSVDISALLLPGLSVTRDERSAALATFQYKPGTSPIFPAEMVRTSVEILESGTIFFTGKVNRAYWDLKTRSYRVECSDFLQEHFEGKDDATIISLIPGSSYSVAVFGEREDGWQFALDLMSTTVLDVHFNRFGNLSTPSWAAKTTPDVLLEENQLLNDGAYELELARARAIITQMVVTYQYRYNRWKVRSHSFGWAFTVKGTPDGADDWCDWAQNVGFTMPTREIILGAANGTGWALKGGINFTAHPDTGNYCGGLINWVTTDEAQAQVAIAAAWNGTRHWGQTITEDYEITLDVLARQTTYGVVSHEDSITRQIEADDSSFEANPLGTITGSPDPIGDQIENQGDEIARVADLNTVIQTGIAKLWEGYRQNTVTVEAEFRPEMELAQTVQITTSDIDTIGKVSRIEHNVGGTLASTRLTLIIMSGGGGTGDPIVIPGPPNTDPGYPPPAASTNVPTYVGGCATAPVFDPAWEGWTTNMAPATCSGGAPAPDQIYPLRFSIRGPDIEDAARDAVEGTGSTTFNVAVPEDPLVLF